MRACEFITEIDYTAAVADLQITDSFAIQNSVLVGDIDNKDVWKLDAKSEDLYFFHKDNKIEAYVVIDSVATNGYYCMHGIRNVTAVPGAITALVGFITHRLKYKVKIAANEKLSTSGFLWLKSFLLADGRGLTVHDQTGRFPNLEEIEKEWNEYRNKSGHGYTEIMIESKMSRVLETKENTKNRLLGPSMFFIGDSKIL